MVDLNELKRLDAECDYSGVGSFALRNWLAGNMPKLIAEIEALRRDKARLDWLESYSSLRIQTFTESGFRATHIEGDGTALRVRGSSLRYAIDTAKSKVAPEVKP